MIYFPSRTTVGFNSRIHSIFWLVTIQSIIDLGDKYDESENESAKLKHRAASNSMEEVLSDGGF